VLLAGRSVRALGAQTVTRWNGTPPMNDARKRRRLLRDAHRNDDVWSIDAAFESGQRSRTATSGSSTWATGTAYSRSGFSNHTSVEQPARAVRGGAGSGGIAGLIEQVPDRRRAVFNLHVPPIDTGLDTVTALDATSSPSFAVAVRLMIPAGSSAVRQAIRGSISLCSRLHGQHHESKGVVRIGRTVCVNPGSTTIGADRRSRHTHRRRQGRWRSVTSALMGGRGQPALSDLHAEPSA